MIQKCSYFTFFVHFFVVLINIFLYFQIMIPPHARRNYSEIYRKVEIGVLSQEVERFDFSEYLKALLPRPLNSNEKVVIFALPYFKRLVHLIDLYDKR